MTAECRIEAKSVTINVNNLRVVLESGGRGMQDEDKTKEQLIHELLELRRRNIELNESGVWLKAILQAVREGKRRYRILTNSITQAIFTLDANQNFTFLSPEFEDITGHHIQDLLWHPFIEILAPEYVGLVPDNIVADKPFETQFMHKDGRRIAVELSITQILDNSDQPMTVILGAVRDLTEHKQMAGELLKAQKLESIGVLAGGIAHDFNNILTAILGNLSLAKTYIEAHEATDKVLEKLTAAEEMYIQAASITQRLLTFSKGGLPIKKVVPVSGLLIESTNFALSGSNVRCEFSIPDDLWLAEIDAGQVNQVINNIVINADQAMPEGGVVRVCAENATVREDSGLPLQPGAYLKISVEDHGVGISPENLLKIFDPYFTTKQDASGLGLAMSYSIITKHDGYITAESQVGYGTVFHVYIPASPEAASVEGSEEKEESTAEAIMGKGRILVMDDELFIREFVSEVLTNAGHEVTTAVNGTEAVGLYKEAKALQRTYDMVILDLTVPGGDGGKEAIQRLMKIDPEVKAIVSSGYSDHPVMANFREYGFKDALVKPYQIEELSALLHRMLTENG